MVKPFGNRAVLERLLWEAKHATPAHAYLFEGAEGVGKRETAYYFAAALLCSSRKEPPCGICENCILSGAGNNPDLKRFMLRDITTKKSIGAEEIRQIISDVSIKPFRSERKIYIIEDADALTPQAQNAMLKILEEPPSYVVFILCTTNVEQILPTVQSRSRLVRFLPKNAKEMRSYVMQKYPYMEDKLDFIVAFSAGIDKRADMLCKDMGLFSLRLEVLDDLAAMLAGRDELMPFRIFAKLDEYRKQKDENDRVSLYLDFMVLCLSDMVHLKERAAASLVNADILPKIQHGCDLAGTQRIVYAADRVLLAQQMLKRYVAFKPAVLSMLFDIFYCEK